MIERLMITMPVSRSMSAQRNAQASPRRAPDAATRWRNTPNSVFSSNAAARIFCTSAIIGGSSCGLRARGGVALAATLTGTQPQRTAWASARRITECTWRTVVGESLPSRINAP